MIGVAMYEPSLGLAVAGPADVKTNAALVTARPAPMHTLRVFILYPYLSQTRLTRTATRQHSTRKPRPPRPSKLRAIDIALTNRQYEGSCCRTRPRCLAPGGRCLSAVCGAPTSNGLHRASERMGGSAGEGWGEGPSSGQWAAPDVRRRRGARGPAQR